MLEEKVETLTKEIVSLRKVLEAALPGLTGGAAATDAGETTTAKKAPAKKAPAKKATAKKVEPTHDADEVAQIMRKAAKEVDKAKIQEYIGEQDCSDLAELLTKPELFDDAHAFASEMLGEEAEDESDEEDI